MPNHLTQHHISQWGQQGQLGHQTLLFPDLGKGASCHRDSSPPPAATRALLPFLAAGSVQLFKQQLSRSRACMANRGLSAL